MPYLPPNQSDRKRREAEQWEDQGIEQIAKTRELDSTQWQEPLERAVHCLEKSLSILPDQPSSVYYLAFAQDMLADVVKETESELSYADLAITNYRKLLAGNNTPEQLLKVNDLFSNVLYRRARMSADVNEKVALLDEALAAIESAIANEHASEDVLASFTSFHGLVIVEKAQCIDQSDRLALFKSAAEVFQNASDRNPADLMVRYNLGKALLDVSAYSVDQAEKIKWLSASQKTHEQALSACQDKSLVGDQEIPPFLKYNYACVLSLIGSFDSAMDVLKEIVSSDVHSAEEIAEDPDFLVMHSRADFQELIGKSSK